MKYFCMDGHMHFDLYKNRFNILEYIETNQSYTIVMTNLPKLYEKYYYEDWNYKFVRLSLGFHPELAAQYYDQISIFKKYVNSTRYIGEIGLDYSVSDEYNKEQQRKIFNEIIRCCRNDENKILSVHTRKAESDCLRILYGYKGKVIFHWYSGNLTCLDIALRRGYYFCINHQMTRSINGRRIINRLPLNRIIIESDAPFTTGMQNSYQLQFIDEIYNYLSDNRSVCKNDIIKQIKENFRMIVK